VGDRVISRITYGTKKGAQHKKPRVFTSVSGRARTMATRWRSDRGLLPRQLRSIDGPHKKGRSYVYSQHKHYLYPSTVYTHIHVFEITPLRPLCKVPKPPLNTSFLYRQNIYAIFVLIWNRKNI